MGMRMYEETERNYKVVSIRLTPSQYEYVRHNIPNFSQWVRHKIEEEMKKSDVRHSFIGALLSVLRGTISIQKIDGTWYLVFEPGNGVKMKYELDEIHE